MRCRAGCIITTAKRDAKASRFSVSTKVDTLSPKCRHLGEIMQPSARTRIRSHTSGLRGVIFDAHVAENDGWKSAVRLR